MKVLERINNTAYKIHIPPYKYLVSDTFDLAPFHGNEVLDPTVQSLHACRSGQETMYPISYLPPFVP